MTPTTQADLPARGRGAATIVMYHAVSSPADPYTVTPKAFREQMQLLSQHFEMVRLGDIPDALRNGSHRRRRVAITFDDAFRDFRANAYPVLRELNIPATVFVPTGYLGRSNEWDAANGSLPRRAIMTAAEIRTLHEEGLVDFGSHTVDHRSMAHLSLPEMRTQAEDSRRTLEDILSTPVRTFAYPYGQLDNYSRETTAVLADAGYKLAVTTHWGTAERSRSVLTLRRVHFADDDSAKIILAKVSGRQDWRGAKERIGWVLRSVRKTGRA